MTARGRYLLLHWGPVVGMCTVIFIQSSFRSPDVLPHITHLDKLMHMAAYGVLAALFLRAYQPMVRFKNRPFLLLAVSIISATLYGLSDEFHQAWVSVRHADLMDWVADGVGSVVGAISYFALCKKLGRTGGNSNSA